MRKNPLKAAVGLIIAASGGAPGWLAAQTFTIEPAPAFGAADLLELPSRNWITNGGNIYNQRYSMLDQINRGNVTDVKAEWRTSLNGSGMGPGYSHQAQLIAYEGTLFAVTGENDVFAVDVETGDILWTYEADVDFDNAIVCCGRLSRGVGLGDGKVFLGRLDGRLLALDQRTGRVIWNVLAGDPAHGYGITAAPLYYDGMVITGFTGGEYAVRGKVTAYDADTGDEIWNFYTVPGPGEIGHLTWPQDNDAWKFGGASVWQTPSIDPQLGLIYFSTGNAGPDLNGAIRAGDNLFTVSVVALDVATGEYRWHFQMVRHDIWDYDAPNPTILFDAEYDGILRRGIASVSKGGYLYILDRTTGVPLTPVIETPVPQDAINRTAATQPIPQGDWVIRHDVEVVGEDFEGILRNRARTFTPFNADLEAIWRPFSGITWHPSSYNLDNNLMYICAGDGPGRGQGGDPDATIGPEGDTRSYVQGNFRSARDIGTDTRSTLVAMDVTNHEVRWRRLLDNRCAGTITTAGGLIFAGRFNGELTALDSDTGQRLWSYQTDGGFTTTVTSFEHDGTQYLAGIAGGSITGGRSNDGLWLFSLNGTMEPFPPGSGDRPNDDFDFDIPEEAGEAETRAAVQDALPERDADLVRGGEIYQSVCIACHGLTAEGGGVAPGVIRDDRTVADIIATAYSGIDGTAMVSFSNTYSVEELQDVATYIVERLLSQR